MTEAVLLYNPAAGRFPLSQKRLSLLLQSLRQQGVMAQPVCTRLPSRAVSRLDPNSTEPLQPTPEDSGLDLDGKDRLIVYGGDGTLHEAFRLAAPWNIPVALLPAGTANVLARELGISLRLKDALAIAASGTVRNIYLGEASGRYFHLMAGIGLDADVIARVPPGLKRTLGIGAYWLTGLAALWNCPLRPFHVTLDGTEWEASFAVIANARLYGGHLLMAPQASVYQECLDVCLFTSNHKTRFLNYLWGVLRRRHLDYPDVVYRKVQRVEVTGDPSVPVQMDGELVGNLPMSFSVFSRGVQIVVP